MTIGRPRGGASATSFTLSTVARHLGVSINRIARAIERAAPLFADDDQLLEVLLVD